MEQKEDKQKQKVMVIIRILAGVCFFFIGLWLFGWNSYRYSQMIKEERKK